MDRLTDSTWWWDVAFDGIASSLLAAALAVWLVMWQLKADRRTAREDRVLQQCRSLVDLTRRVRAEHHPRLDEGASRELLTLLDGWQPDLYAFIGTVRADEANLTKYLTAAADAYASLRPGDVSQWDAREAAFSTVEYTLLRRLQGPEHFEALPSDLVEKQVEAIGRGMGGAP